MPKMSVRGLEVKGRRVLVRVDFNVPTEEVEEGIRITDDTRIRESLPTIQLLRDKGARIVLLAHFGRPKGKPNPKYTLRPVAKRLAELVGAEVEFSPEVIGDKAKKASRQLAEGGIWRIENVRFYEQEEANDTDFARQLARLGDMFVNDAFGAAHRAHASTEGVAHCLSPAAMGLLMEKELRYLQDGLATPERPFLVILGGAKVSDKIGVIKALMEKADVFLIGGAMAYTFYRALGIPTGASRVDGGQGHLAEELLRLAQRYWIKLLLPVDNIETDEFKAGGPSPNPPVFAKERRNNDGLEALEVGTATVPI